MKVLVADSIAEEAIELLQSETDLEVIRSNPNSFTEHLGVAHALLVRSSVKVTKEIMDQAPHLRVIGRAGVGVDNINCEEATKRGIVVMNTPGGNAISVAEHTMALILSLARTIPQANTSTKSGKWDRKRFTGNELYGKTLGIIGLGNIGRMVAERSKPFGMEVIAYDPFISSDAAKDCGVELLGLDALYARADYISLHLSLTPDTKGMINAAAIEQMKSGMRIINCARGELIDSSVLNQGILTGKVSGAALDVFDVEPPGSLPLLQHHQVIATPHIGGSTAEAHTMVGINIAQQVRDYLKTGMVSNAVNMPSISAEQYGKIAPYLALAERLGSFSAQTSQGRPVRIKVTFSGDFGESDSSLIRKAALSGVLNCFLSQKANLINANQIAQERAIGVSEVRRGKSHFNDSIQLELKTEDIVRSVEGTVFPDGSPRLLSINGIYVEALLSGNLLYITNKDVPGVIGRVGSVLGDGDVNISDFALGRASASQPDEPAEAAALIRTDNPIPSSVLNRLYDMKAVMLAKTIKL